MHQIIQIFKYLVGIGLIVWLITTNQINLDMVQHLTAQTIIFATFLSFLSLFFATVRLNLLLNNQSFNISSMNTYKLNMLGIFYSLFLPGGISGDVLKGYHLLKYRNDNNTKTNIVTTLFLDRYLGLLSMFILASLVLQFAINVPNKLEFLYYLIALITSGLIVMPFIIYGVIIFFHDHHIMQKYDYLYDKIIKIKDSTKKFMNIRLLLSSLFLGFLGHLMTILIIWIVSENLNASIGLLNALIITPLAFVVNLLPISPGGIGVGEKAFQELFLVYGIAGGATVFFISRFFMYLPGLLGLYVFLQKKTTDTDMSQTHDENNRSKLSAESSLIKEKNE